MQFIEDSLHMIFVNTQKRNLSSSRYMRSRDLAFWFCLVKKLKNSLVSISNTASVTNILNISWMWSNCKFSFLELITKNSMKLMKTLILSPCQTSWLTCDSIWSLIELIYLTACVMTRACKSKFSKIQPIRDSKVTSCGWFLFFDDLLPIMLSSWG